VERHFYGSAALAGYAHGSQHRHHCCHAASAFLLSAFDKAPILTLDKEDDGKAVACRGERSQIRVQDAMS
jgi:predicted NodU family carbamoyl transferase